MTNPINLLAIVLLVSLSVCVTELRGPDDVDHHNDVGDGRCRLLPHLLRSTRARQLDSSPRRSRSGLGGHLPGQHVDSRRGATRPRGRPSNPQPVSGSARRHRALHHQLMPTLHPNALRSQVPSADEDLQTADVLRLVEPGRQSGRSHTCRPQQRCAPSSVLLPSPDSGRRIYR